MADTRPKHKPNEKHTLDEVLKSLRDLVSNEVLDKPAPPAPEPKSAPPPAAPAVDMSDIINSLEDLLETDLKIEDRPKPVSKPAAQVPAPAPAAATPKPPAPTAAFAKHSAPPVAPAPMIETEDDLELDMTAEAGEAPPALTFPEEMSDEDIAKALADIEFEMMVTPTPTPEPEMGQKIGEALPPVRGLEVTEDFSDAAPALELTVQEPTTDAPTIAQQELPLGAPALSPTSTLAIVEEESPIFDAEENNMGMDAEEIDAAPPPPQMADAPDSSAEDVAPPSDLAPWEDSVTEAGAAEALTLETPAAPAAKSNTVEYTPSAKAKPAPDTTESPTVEVAAPAPLSVDDALVSFDDLSPPLQEESSLSGDAILSRSEPPMPEDTAGGDTGSSLGGTMELDVSGGAPTTAPTPAAHDDIPTLEDVALAPPPTALPSKPAPATKPAPAAKTKPETIELPLPPSPDPIHKMAVNIVAKLNIEMRKAGKPPLDAKSINRLQQLMRESLKNAEKETDKK